MKVTEIFGLYQNLNGKSLIDLILMMSQIDIVLDLNQIDTK